MDNSTDANDNNLIQVSLPMRVPPPALSRVCDRHGLSDTSAGALASAMLEDFGLVTAADSSNVIDHNKIQCERKKHEMDHYAVKNSQMLNVAFIPWT